MSYNSAQSIQRILEVLADSSTDEEAGPEDAGSSRRRRIAEDEADRAALFREIARSEILFYQIFLRGTNSPEEAVAQMAELYRITRKDIGFHVDCWPPRPVSSNLLLRKIANAMHNDRFPILKEIIEMFRGRPRCTSGTTNDSVVIIAESDDVIEKIFKALESEGYTLIVIKESDLVAEREDFLNQQITEYEINRNNAVLVCSQQMISHSTIPFGKCNIFHKATDRQLFHTFVQRVTVNSRHRKEESQIHVPFNILDKPEIVEYAAMLLGLRGEPIDSNLLDYVEQQCWRKEPQTRGLFEEWVDKVKQEHSKEEEETLQILGIHVEFWWNNEDTMSKVQLNARPLKEIGDHLPARPWEQTFRSESEDEEVTKL